MGNDIFIDLEQRHMRVKTPRRKWSKQLLIGFIAVLILLLVGVGIAYALSMHEVEQENILASHTTAVGIEETFPDGTVTPGATKTKQVAFKNEGTAPVFVRVAYAEEWTNGTAWLSDDGTHVTKNWTPAWASDWTLIDGWYYYKKVLPQGATTDKILESVTFPAGLEDDYKNGQYDLSFLVEVVQLSDEASVNTSSTQSVWDRTATVTITTTSAGAVTAGTVAWS